MGNWTTIWCLPNKRCCQSLSISACVKNTLFIGGVCAIERFLIRNMSPYKRYHHHHHHLQHHLSPSPLKIFFSFLFPQADTHTRRRKKKEHITGYHKHLYLKNPERIRFITFLKTKMLPIELTRLKIYTNNMLFLS